MELPGFNIISLINETSTTIMLRAENLENGNRFLIRALKNTRATPAEFLYLKNDYIVARGLKSPYVLKPVSLQEIGEITAILYEDFSGVSLKRIMALVGLSISDKLRLAIDITNALDELHKGNIVHKNICPTNILYDVKSRQIKIIDFRFASGQFNAVAHRLDSLLLSSSLAYISPEQTTRVSRNMDYRSDYYSLGTMLYELFGYVLPHVSLNESELIHWHIALKPRALHTINSEVPQGLSLIIDKLMAKMAENRYQSRQGIVHDLTFCLQEFEKTGEVKPFPLGINDFTSEFLLSEKIYGREKEIDLLQSMVSEVINGSMGVLLLSGAAGSGKTKLANELLNMAPGKAVLCIKGKFEQFQSNEHYFAFAQAFNELCAYVLSLPEEELIIWREKFTQALGKMGRVLTDLVPLLEKIIGTQPALLSLGASETSNRFNQVINNFLDAIVSQNLPLFIVIDDLQWASPESRNLFNNIAARFRKCFLLVGAFREKELADATSFSNQLAQVRSHAVFKHQKLNNINLQDVSELISDTLQMTSSDVESLAQHVIAVTNGDPLFTIQYFESLYRGGYILADEGQKCWTWRIPSEEFSAFRLNILSLFEERINSLPEACVNLLKLAVCFGNQFNLNDLALVQDVAQEKIKSLLEPALYEGIISCSDTRCVFLHDRVQQVLMSLFGEGELFQLRKKVALSLLAEMVKQPEETRLFEIVRHINAAIMLFGDSERKLVFDINLKAAQKALNTTAYSAALEYLEVCQIILPQLHASDEYDFIVNFLIAKVLYLQGKHDAAKKALNIAFSTRLSHEDKVKSYALLKDICVSSGKDYEQAVSVGIEILSSMGVDWDHSRVSRSLVIRELSEKIERITNLNNIDSILNLSAMSDEISLFRLRLVMDLWEAAYYAVDPELMQCCMFYLVATSLEKGNAPESAFGYVLYGTYFAFNEDFDNAYIYGDLALKLNKKSEDQISLPKVTNLFCNYISFYKKNFAYSAELYETSMLVGRENGDHLFGLWAAFFNIWTRFLAGEPLNTLYRGSMLVGEFVNQINDDKMIKAFRMLQIMFLNLMDETEDSDALIFENQNVEEYFDYWQANQFLPATTWYGILDAQLKLLNNDYVKGLQSLEMHIITEDPSIVMFPLSQLYFYRALHALLARIYQHETESLDQNQLDQIILFYKIRADGCPENFATYYFLLQAVKAHYLGNNWDCISWFESALLAATNSQSQYLMALVNELNARFWAASGNSRYARESIAQAIHFYQEWGAKRKVKLLNNEFSELLRIAEMPLKALARHVEYVGQLKETKQKTEDGLSLDFAAILRTIQEISAELTFDKLLSKILNIVIQNTAAERGLIIVVRNNVASVEIETIVSSTKSISELPRSLESYERIPKSIIQYVMRSSQDVVIQNAMKHELFGKDAYVISNNIRSVLCEVISHTQEIKAILYLENNLIDAAFSSERMLVTRIILSQVATAVENALLYENLQEEIKEHKNTESALRESETRLRLSQHYANIGAWEWHVASNKIYCTEKIAMLMGLTAGYSLKNFDDIISAVYTDDREKVKNAFEQCMRGNILNVEHRIITQQGQFHWLLQSGDVERDKNGNIIRLLSIVQDITARKNAELDLRESESRFRQLAENIHEVFWISSPDLSNIYYVSPAYRRMFGYEESELYQDKTLWIKLVHADDRQKIIDVVQSKVKTKFSDPNFPLFRIIHANGEIRWLDAHAYPVFNEKNEVGRIVGIAEDITEKMQREEQIRRSQKMDALGKLTGGIAHDFNNMLGVILGYAELLQLNVDPTSKGIRYIDEIVTAGERAKKLTGKLLSFSRTEPRDAAPADINKIISGLQHMLEKTLTARVKLILDLSPALWQTFLEVPRLEDAILNMSINSMHAMPDGGALLIKTSNIDLTSAQAEKMHVPPGEYIKLSVIDNGIGMAEEVKQHLFDPFFTTKGEKGTGLGMSQVYAFIQQSRAYVQVESKPGQGTSISIFFPRYYASETLADENKEYVDTGLEGKGVVLVVDDEIAIASLANEILTSAGYQVYECHRASEALDLLAREKIDLLLTDVIMPDMDGYVLVNRVSEEYPQIKIQLMSGFTNIEEDKKIESDLITNLLKKPFTRYDILLKVGTLLK